MSLPDVQSQPDIRQVDLDWVGVKNVKLPIMVLQHNEHYMSTLASINLFASLGSTKRGTHMSRFLEVLFSHAYNSAESEKPWKFKMLHEFVSKVLIDTVAQQTTSRAYLSVKFNYPMLVAAPATEAVSWISSTIKLEGVYTGPPISRMKTIKWRLGISHYGTTYCVCSKELCKDSGGVHGQRCLVEVRLATEHVDLLPDFEEIIDAIRECVSSPIYNLLKRPDEKYVTEKGYQNAKFVEDVTRDFVSYCNVWLDGELISYDVKATSEESIHTHSAVAYFKQGDIHI